jgi:hypothetical protein
LRDVLQKYTNVLTRFSNGLTETNAVTAIISGNRAARVMAAEPVRYAALDGRPEDLNDSSPRELVPLISEDWKRFFKWRGVGPFAVSEKQHLRELIDQTHRQGRQLRFWGTADRLEIWNELLGSGVDLLNADDLSGLAKFLRRQLDRPGP